jgi:catalase
MFYNSLSEVEQTHIIAAARFELGHVESQVVRERMVAVFNRISNSLAVAVAGGIGVAAPDPLPEAPTGRRSKALSQVDSAYRGAPSAVSRKVALLIAEGFEGKQLNDVKHVLKAAGALPIVVAPIAGPIKPADGGTGVKADFTFWTSYSVLFDAVCVIGGDASVKRLSVMDDAIMFVREAYKHGKAVGGVSEGVRILRLAGIAGMADEPPADTESKLGVVIAPSASSSFSEQFIQAVSLHRNWYVVVYLSTCF